MAIPSKPKPSFKLFGPIASSKNIKYYNIDDKDESPRGMRVLT